MRRAVFILLTVCLVLCFIDALALDYSQYEIRNRFTMDVNLLKEGEQPFYRFHQLSIHII